MTKATLREKNGGRTKKKCVGSSVRCWLNLSRRSAVWKPRKALKIVGSRVAAVEFWKPCSS